MSVEIGEPLTRIADEAAEELPPIAGCGWVDPDFDPLADWKARRPEVAETKRYGSPIPGVEGMPGWLGFVGWEAAPEVEQASTPASVEPVSAPKPAPPASVEPVSTSKPVPPAKLEPPSPDEPPSVVTGGRERTIDLGADSETPTSISLEPSGGDEPTMNLGSINLEPAGGDEPTMNLGSINLEPAGGDEPTMNLGSINLEPAGGDEPTMNLGSINLEPVSSTRRPAPPAMAPSPSKPPSSGSGLSPKLAGAKPLAHPGRLPKGFVLSVAEKKVLRACNGRTPTSQILAGCSLEAADLTAFLKRCAGVKLVTFKR